MMQFQLCVRAAILGVALACSSPSKAAVITFDDFTAVPSGNGSAEAVKVVSSGGFDFVAPEFHIVVDPALCGFGGCVGNGTHYATSDIPDRLVNPTRGGPVTMARSGGGRFSLLAFDGSDLVLDDLAARLAGHPNAFTIEVDGHQSGGGTLSASFILDGIRDGDGGLPDFETFNFGSDWTDLISVDWSGATGVRPGNMAFDNIIVTVEVAEPAFLGLFGLALLGMLLGRSARGRLARSHCA